MTETDLEVLKNEVHRRIGRNLDSYQRLERMLKGLLSLGPVRGPARELNDLRAKRAGEVRKLTLGLLAGEFVDLIVTDTAPLDRTEMLAITEPHVSLSIHFEMGAESRADLEHGLSKLVEARNRLVHHLHEDWDMDSPQSTQALVGRLDADREQLLPVYEHVRRMSTYIAEAASDYSEYLNSEEFSSQFRQFMTSQQPLVQGLVACIDNLARSDGWLALGTAGRVLRREMPREFEDFEKRFGHPTLKQWMLTTGLFELREEDTASGSRTMYRLARGVQIGAD